MVQKALTYDDIQLIPASISWIKSRKDISLTTKFTKRYNVDCPIILSPMNTVVDKNVMVEMNRMGSVAILPRFMTNEERFSAISYVKNNIKNYNIPIAVSYGLKDSDDFISESYLKGVEVFLLDIANGHNIFAWIDIAERKKFFSENYIDTPEFILGNLASEITEENWSTLLMILKDKLGSALSFDIICKYFFPDAFRVGIGGGSACSTRITTGFGVPMIQSIINIKKSISNLERLIDEKIDIPIIADGGIRMPGDAMKAIAVGADTIMAGSLFAGTKESPSNIVEIDSNKYKIYEGSASYSAKTNNGMIPEFIEGVKAYIPFDETKTIQSVIKSFEDGLKSGLSYAGMNSLEDKFNKINYYEITQSGIIEATPHLKDIKW